MGTVTEYVTGTGYKLSIGRVDRRRIDRAVADLHRPQPPVVKAADLGIEVFGGIDEDVYQYDDPAYRDALYLYYLQAMTYEFAILSSAVDIDQDYQGIACSLRKAGVVGIDEDDHVAVLRYEVLRLESDWEYVVDQVIYQSTVTERGIDEANTRFLVTWYGESLDAVSVPGTPANYSTEFEARNVAMYTGYTWDQFCQLEGPDQSAEVAFYRSRLMLEWLETHR